MSLTKLVQISDTYRNTTQFSAINIALKVSFYNLFETKSLNYNEWINSAWLNIISLRSKLQLSKEEKLLFILLVHFFELKRHCNCFKMFFLVCAPFGCYIFLSFHLLNEQGPIIDPGMALTPFPSRIRWDSNPQPFDRESSSLPTRPDFRPALQLL